VAAELEAMGKVRYIQPMALAWVYAGLHDKEATLLYLEKAYSERDLIFMTVDYQINFVRDDPRFQTILRQMKLPLARSAS
jgi:hypothetical protein